MGLGTVTQRSFRPRWTWMDGLHRVAEPAAACGGDTELRSAGREHLTLASVAGWPAVLWSGRQWLVRWTGPALKRPSLAGRTAPWEAAGTLALWWGSQSPFLRGVSLVLPPSAVGEAGSHLHWTQEGPEVPRGAPWSRSPSASVTSRLATRCHEAGSCAFASGSACCWHRGLVGELPVHLGRAAPGTYAGRKPIG